MHSFRALGCQRLFTRNLIGMRLVLFLLFLQGTSSLVPGTSAFAYSGLYVFGDSLSDVGNTSTWSAGFFPGSTYWNGRFSSGPVYSELLSQQLDLGTLATSTDNGNNYAYGGAKTSGTTGISGAVIDDLGEQVDDYTDNRTADPEALYIVWAGANDLFDGQTNMSIPVGNITSDMERLYNHGARQFLVMNLPKLGATPAYNSNSATAATWTNRTVDFNTQLNNALDDLAINLPELSLLKFDIETLFDEVIANPSSYGLTNVTAPAAPGLDPGDLFYSDSNIVANPEQYLFWDTVHPTATMHAHLADAIYDFLQPDILAGDYNLDGIVNLADFTVWRDTLGSVGTNLAADGNLSGNVDAADYGVWKSNFNQTIIPTLQPTIVPEPAAALLLAATLCLLLARRPR